MDPTTLPPDVQSLTIEHNGASIPVHEHPFVKNTPDLATLFKRAIDSDAEVGRRVRVPGKDAKAEDVDGFYSKLEIRPPDAWMRKQLGVPEKATEYEYVKPEGVPDGLTWNDELIGKAQEMAHKVGLNKQQFGEMLNLHNEVIAKMVSESQNIFNGNAQESTKSLKEKWGADYDKNWALAEQGAEKFFDGDKDLIELTAKSGLALTPRFAEKMKEYALATGEDHAMSTPKSNDSVEQAISAITTPGTEKFKLWQAGDAKVGQELVDLYNKRHNGQMVSLG